MRMDRLISVNLMLPAIRLGLVPSRGRLPILMYHSISAEPEPHLGHYFKLNTPPELFANHLRLLKEQGFTTVGLKEAAALATGETPASDKPAVVITFDDGFKDFLEYAWPALQIHGFTASMFLPTRFIGKQTLSFKGKPCLTWDEVRDLRRKGISFGSHTASHPELPTLSWTEIESELRESRDAMQTELNETVDEFCHPYAFPHVRRDYVEGLEQRLSAIGYTSGVTTRLGRVKRGDRPLVMPRLPANSSDDLPLLSAKLAGAYDWLGTHQTLWKRLRSSMPSSTPARSN